MLHSIWLVAHLSRQVEKGRGTMSKQLELYITASAWLEKAFTAVLKTHIFLPALPRKVCAEDAETIKQHHHN